MASLAMQHRQRRQSTEETQNGLAENDMVHNTPHNSTFTLVPFLVLLIGIGGTIRAWQFMLPPEHILQCFFLIVLALPVLSVVFFPRLFYNHRAIFVTTSRLGITLLPSSKHLIAKLVNADSSLGQKWAQTNPIGALGILIFASRSLVFWASSAGTRMNFLPTLCVQTLLAVLSYHTEPELCRTAKLATSPGVLSFFTAVHSFLNSAWTIVLPFPHVTPPPAHVIDPGTSLTAITFMIKVVSLVAPLIASANRAAHDYDSSLSSRTQHENTAHPHRRHRHRSRRYEMRYLPSRTTTTPATTAALAATLPIEEEDEYEDGDYDVAYDPIENNLVPVYRNSSSRYIRYAAPHSHNTRQQQQHRNQNPNNLRNTTYREEVPLFASNQPQQQQHYTNSTAHDSVTNNSTKKAPIIVQMVLAFRELCNYPIHAAWLVVAGTCALWAGSYKLATSICANAAGAGAT